MINIFLPNSKGNGREPGTVQCPAIGDTGYFQQTGLTYTDQHGQVWLRANGQPVTRADYDMLDDSKFETFAQGVGVVTPAMDANSVDGWTASASSLWTGVTASSGFARRPAASTFWTSQSGVVAASLQIRLPQHATATSYSFQARDTAYWGGTPSEWVLEGSTNGTNWYQLDYRTGQMAQQGLILSYPIASPVASTYYRIRAVKDQGPGVLGNGVASLANFNLYHSDPLVKNTVVLPATADGNAYLKVSGSCPDTPTEVRMGQTDGQLLVWDGTQTVWTDPAKLTFDATTGLFAELAQINVLRDSAGRVGADDQVLITRGGRTFWVDIEDLVPATGP